MNIVNISQPSYVSMEIREQKAEMETIVVFECVRVEACA